ncbi:hypothetical protein SRL2020028_49770 [Mycobacterium kiyosense]|uniref:Uncharacterized protein n=1 Tax=Mycobacterium kiyosense TaxID=2871094 RepID=A0AA37PWT4_9MYCO|nr:hypothetical protein SRL2020028_49770 [Mycobacterium kiyosense]
MSPAVCVLATVKAARVLALVVMMGAGLAALQAGKVPVHYSLYATCWTLLMSAAVGVVALWPMEIALKWMTRRRVLLTPKVQR